MNKTYLRVLPLTLLLAAYSGQSVAGELSQRADLECEGVSLTPMVTFDVSKMEAEPECVLARLGTTIVLRLTSKKDMEKGLESVTVSIDPKDSFDSWLKGRNHPFDDVIFIRVPGKYEPNRARGYSTHHYSVEVNGQKIDPRIEVEH